MLRQKIPSEPNVARMCLSDGFMVTKSPCFVSLQFKTLSLQH